MTNVVHHDFSKRSETVLFSADVYSHDMRKYQFEIFSVSITDAYSLFIAEAQKLGVHFVRCIAVYKGNIKGKFRASAPLKVWQQGWTMNGLTEF